MPFRSSHRYVGPDGGRAGSETAKQAAANDGWERAEKKQKRKKGKPTEESVIPNSADHNGRVEVSAGRSDHLNGSEPKAAMQGAECDGAERAGMAAKLAKEVLVTNVEHAPAAASVGAVTGLERSDGPQKTAEGMRARAEEQEGDQGGGCDLAANRKESGGPNMWTMKQLNLRQRELDDEWGSSAESESNILSKIAKLERIMEFAETVLAEVLADGDAGDANDVAAMVRQDARCLAEHIERGYVCSRQVARPCTLR